MSCLQFDFDKVLRSLTVNGFKFRYFRFRDPSSEISMDRAVIPPLCDNHKLSISEYRSKLYEVSFKRIFYSGYSIWLPRMQFFLILVNVGYRHVDKYNVHESAGCFSLNQESVKRLEYMSVHTRC